MIREEAMGALTECHPFYGDDDRIIAHTKLLNPGETDSIKFPGQVAGIYEFVCTFPGHSATMFGEFKCLQSGQR